MGRANKCGIHDEIDDNFILKIFSAIINFCAFYLSQIIIIIFFSIYFSDLFAKLLKILFWFAFL